MVNVPIWLVHPVVCPVRVNVPELERIPIPILPNMTIVLVPVLSVHDIVIIIALPFIIPDPIWPLIIVPEPKHAPSEPMLPKLRLLVVRAVLFWVISNVNDPSWFPEESASVSDHAPFAETAFCGEEPPPQATSVTAVAMAVSSSMRLIRHLQDQTQ